MTDPQTPAPSDEVQRWQCVYDHLRGGPVWKSTDAGSWVVYDGHCAKVAALEAELDALRKIREDAMALWGDMTARGWDRPDDDLRDALKMTEDEQRHAIEAGEKRLNEDDKR
jgi:hypothetical protein